MKYCAMDVQATHEVFTEQLPLFMERSSSSASHLNHVSSSTSSQIAKNSTFFSIYFQMSSPGDICRYAGNGCELPPRQSKLGALSGGFSGHLWRTSAGDEEVSDDSGWWCLSAPTRWQVMIYLFYYMLWTRYVCFSWFILSICEDTKMTHGFGILSGMCRSSSRRKHQLVKRKTPKKLWKHKLLRLFQSRRKVPS